MTDNFFIHTIIMIGILVIIGYFLLGYLNGKYSYEDKIIASGNILDNYDNIKGKYYDIERVYENGRIKVRREKVYTN